MLWQNSGANMNLGWVKLHRKLSDNKLWTSEPFTRGQAWVDMLMLANHKEDFFYVRGNRVTVQRGQLGWSQLGLSKRWSWSRGKTKRFLNELEIDQQIVQQNNFISSLIIIVNYEQYQGDGQQTVQRTDSRRTADGQQTDTNKNVKNDKKEKNVKKKNKDYPPLFEEWWNIYPKRNGKRVGKADTFVRWAKVKELDYEDMMTATRNYAASDEMAKDPERFFKLDKGNLPYWREWMEPATPDKQSDKGEWYE